MNFSYWTWCWVLLVPGILYASWVDGKERRVPNWLNALILVVGMLVQVIHPEGAGWQEALLGALTGFGVLIIPWLIYGMGAGDVKLMAAIGAWFGVKMTLWSFVVGAAFGGVIGVIMILLARKTRHALANMTTIMVKFSNPSLWFSNFGGAKSFGDTSQLLPYGIPLTMGAILILGGVTFNWWSFS
ncbi:MAG: hypothetical protein HJJLKODD_00259 [Phycisphaerae bacterium]|nr:hypothetical protein [Phycisphaerae bacterium]